MAAHSPYSTDVAVLGAGPYGLSAYAHLREHSVQTRILGEPMRTWRSHMPAGMKLKSLFAASTIGAGRSGYRLEDYCRETGATMPAEHEAVPLELFLGYGDWFAEALAPEVEPTEITVIDRDGPDRFRVGTADGEEFSVRAVVIASGLIGHAYIPPELAALGGGDRAGAFDPVDPLDPADAPVTHSSQHDDLKVFAGREVAVVGAGQSALESAALLAEAGARPTVLVRRPAAEYQDSPYAEPAPGLRGLYGRLPRPLGPLGPGWPLLAVARGPALIRHLPPALRLRLVARVLGPAGAWWLRDRVEGRFPVHTGMRVMDAGLEGGGVTLKLAGTDGDSTLRTDHVISATGYRIGPDAFGFLAPELRDSLRRVRNWPRLGAGFQSSVPGLYFVGFPAAASYGPLMRFVCGTEYASPHVTRAVLARIRH